MIEYSDNSITPEVNHAEVLFELVGKRFPIRNDTVNGKISSLSFETEWKESDNGETISLTSSEIQEVKDYISNNLPHLELK